LRPKELILERAVRATKVFDFDFELLGAVHCPRVHDLPRPDLLPQFGVLTPKAGDFLAQLEHFASKLLNQFPRINRRGSRNRIDKRLGHDKDACNPRRPWNERGNWPENGLGEALRSPRRKYKLSRELRTDCTW
jgi:hypothetical protein